MSDFEEMFEMIRNGATVDEVAQQFGGSNVYVPGLRTIRTDRARAAVPAEYDCTNEKELARKYGVTLAFIRKLVREMMDAAVVDGES